MKKKLIFVLFTIFVATGVNSCTKSTDSVISEYSKDMMFALEAGRDISPEKYVDYAKQFCKSLGVKDISFSASNPNDVKKSKLMLNMASELALKNKLIDPRNKVGLSENDISTMKSKCRGLR